MSEQDKSEAPVIAFKGFDKDLRCRDYQYEIGKTYTHDGDVQACESGFHACANPFDVWSYYAPGTSHFCTVELAGKLSRHAEDSKIAAASISIKAELSIQEFISAAVRFVMDACAVSKETTATTGNGAHAATTGNGAHAATTGYRAHAATTGYGAHAATTGEGAHAATTGEKSIAASLGIESKAKAGPLGCVIVRDDCSERPRVVVGYVGEDGIKADTWYRANGGKLVEVTE